MVQKDCNISQTNKEGAIYAICILFVFDAVGITVQPEKVLHCCSKITVSSQSRPNPKKEYGKWLLLEILQVLSQSRNSMLLRNTMIQYVHKNSRLNPIVSHFLFVPDLHIKFWKTVLILCMLCVLYHKVYLLDNTLI